MLSQLSIFNKWFFKEIQSMSPQWLSAVLLGSPISENVYSDPDVSDLSVTKIGVSIPEKWLLESSENKTLLIKNARVFLPDHMALKRQFTVPRVSQANLENVARLDLMRRTPYDINDIYWAQVGHKNGKTAIEVEQFIVEKKTIHQIERNLGKAGINVDSFAFGTDQAAIFLAKASEQNIQGTRRILLANKVLGCVAVFLLITLVGRHAWQNNQELQSLTAQNQALKQQAIQIRQDIEKQQSDIAKSNKRTQFIYNRHKLSTVLRDLTVALPDDAWVSNVSQQKSNVTVSGSTSKSSADLVLSLGKIQNIHNPRLMGSTSKGQNGDEKFELRYDLRALQ